MSEPQRAALPRGVLAAHLALVVVQVSFGLFPVFGRLAFGPQGFAPLVVAFWRMTVGAAVIWALALAVHRKAAWVPPREWPQLALLGMLGIVANQVLYLTGLERSTAVNAGLVVSLIPVCTFGVAALLGQERFQARRALGVAVALAGGLVWYLREEPALVSEHAVGNLMMLANTVCYAFYLVLSKPVVMRRPPLVVTAWVYLFSALVAPLLVIGKDLWPAAAAPRAQLSLLYILIFPTVVGYLLNTFALRHVRASTTAVYVYLQPTIAAVAGALLLGEQLTAAWLASAAFVFVGIWLVARRPSAPRPAPPPADAPAEPHPPQP